jgi:ribosomal protein S18 acetylase RimI-like enzyme
MAEGHVDYLLNLAESSAGAFLTAITGEQIIGFCVVSITEEDECDLHLQDSFKRAGEVTDLIVHPNHRKRGIGRALISTASAHCQASGVRQLKLKTLAQNFQARNAFETLGFRPHEIIHTIDL